MSPPNDAPAILLVDDEETIREGLARLLQRAGYRVLTAEDGNRAIELMEDHSFDVVLSDVVMPARSGVDVLSTLRATDPRTQFVLMSGMPSIRTASEAVRLDAFDYLTKPVRFGDLLPVIERAVAKKRSIDDESARVSAAEAEIDALRTEVHARSAELDASIARYRELIDSLDIAVVEIDPSTMQLTHVSGRLAHVLFGDAVERPWTIALLDRVDANDRQAMARTICGQDVDHGPACTVYDSEGKVRYVQCIPSSEPRRDPSRFSGVLVDVTERRVAEMEQERLQRELEGARAQLTRRLVENLVQPRAEAPVRIGAPSSQLDDKVVFGVSPAMDAVRSLGRVACAHDETVLLTGETGTGKGVLAEWIHRCSPRSDRSFVAVNCSSLRGDLLSAELFGHARGAFTSAARDRKGLVEEADGGTLFLDEIGEMDVEAQARLLKVLEDKTFRRVGETRERRSDFRLICATNRDLAAMAGEGRFRLDLLYRINVLTIRIPPLRERTEDLEALSGNLLASVGAPEAAIDPDALELLRAHPWPGNVRELRNALIRALLLAHGRVLDRSCFILEDAHPTRAIHASAPRAAPPPPPPPSDERGAILQSLARFDGNKAKAARALGMSRSSLYRKLERYGID